MKFVGLVIAIVLCIQIVSAQDSTEFRATVLEEISLTGITSASGLEKKDDFYYVISDDSPWVYELDSTLKIRRKLLIHHNSFEGVERIPGEVKPDFEAVVNYKWDSKDLLIFGSGSGPERKTMVRIDFTSRGYDVNTYTLENLYAQIMEMGAISAEQLNIEGAASWRDHIILMNRETNQLILIPKIDFDRYMKMDPEKQKKEKTENQFLRF